MTDDSPIASLGLAPGHASLAPWCGDIDLRIARDGTWHYQGTPIGRPALVKLFASVLSRDEAGDYWLTTPGERARIRVEDAPFVAVAMSVHGSGPSQRLRFRTNVDDEIEADPAHPILVRPRPLSGEKAPYLVLRDRLEALIARAVYYDLVALGCEAVVEGRRRFGVISAGSFFPLD